MNCEKSTECGFYKYLVEHKIVQGGDSCVRTKPKECPRYQFSNGENRERAHIAFNGKNIYTEPGPIFSEEVAMVVQAERKDFI